MKNNLSVSVYIKMLLVLAMFAFGVMGIIGCSSGGGGGTPVPTATHTAAPTASHSASPTPTASPSASPTGSPTAGPTSSTYTISGTISWEGFTVSSEGYYAVILTTFESFGEFITVNAATDTKGGSFESAVTHSANFSFDGLSANTYHVFALIDKNQIVGSHGEFTGQPEGGCWLGSYNTGHLPLDNLAFPLSPITAEGTTKIITGINFSLLDLLQVVGDIRGHVADPSRPSCNNGILNVAIIVSGTSTATANTGTDESGEYRAGGDSSRQIGTLPAGTYVVTPSKEGYTFFPTSRTCTIDSMDGVDGVDFIGTHEPVAITGTITSWDAATSIPNATVNASSDGYSSSETTNASGHYSFLAPYNSQYLISVSAEGFYFYPSSKSVTITQETTVNISATYESILGRISSSGGAFSEVNILLGGNSTAITTTDGNGDFSFLGLLNGTYEVTPSKEGYTFDPPTESVTLNGNCAILPSFSSEVFTPTITGTITNAATGSPESNIGIRINDNVVTATNASGEYSFPATYGIRYTVRPDTQNDVRYYSFTPPSAEVNNITENVVQNFIATRFYTISGTAINFPQLVALKYYITSNEGTTSGTINDVENNHEYSTSAVLAGTYTLSLEAFGYVFSPEAQVITIEASNVTAEPFTTYGAYSISGTIEGLSSDTTFSYNLYQGIMLTSSGEVTTVSGAYTIPHIVNDSYTLEPHSGTYTFMPTQETGLPSSSFNFTAQEISPP